MKIFLTGGTGYLGSALIPALLEAGHEVTALARTPKDEGVSARLRWIQGDLRDGPPPSDLLHQHPVVLHSAALVKSWHQDPAEFDRVNVEAYDLLLAECYRLGVGKVIHTSSFLSLGPSPGPEPMAESGRRVRDRFYTDYERTKYLADERTAAWAARGLPVVTLYPTVLFGPGARTDGNLVGKMIHWIVQDRFPGIVGSGRQVWSYAYIEDVVRGHIAALTRGVGGEGYILGGENIALEALVRQVYALLDRPFRVRRIPIPVAETMGWLAEQGAKLTKKAPDLTRGVAGVYREHWSYRSDRAARSLGYRITPFAEALSSTVRWARELERW